MDASDEADDLYLEDPQDERSLALVSRENARVAAWLHDATYEADRVFALSVIEDEDKLFVCVRRGPHLYDFHRGPDHPRGLWRRIPVTERPRADAPWEPVFDVDAHCERHGEWAWRGVADCATDPTRVMVHLAEGGSDVGVHREFDLTTCDFVPSGAEGDGFETPAVRGHVSWEDADTLLATLSTPGHATATGWPGTVRRWRRGEALAGAEVLLRADEADLTVQAYAVGQGPRRTVSLTVHHDINGCRSDVVLRGRDRVTLDLPNPRHAGATSRAVLWQPLEDAGGRGAGSLLMRSLPFDGEWEHVVFEAGERRAVEMFWTSDRWAFAVIADNLVPELHMLDMAAPERGLRRMRLPEGFDTINATWAHADPDAAGDHTLLITASGMLRPATLFRFDPDRDDFDAELEAEAAAKERFDASAMSAQLLEARSHDGTMVPYHLALPAGDGPHPVVIYSYGGYGIPTRANYLSIFGPLLLEHGVGFAFAHIRGGNEFGPAWHRAAIRHGRHRAFEDCAAVARDLVERGLAPERGVAMLGGSNGGLLAAVMATRYPELFGAVAAIVPVTDMLRYHLFPAGRAWIDEYGDPHDEADAAYLRSYSPWHQVVPASTRPYPPVLIDAPVNDDRVDPSHARRLADRLLKAGQPVWLRTAGTGGHGGGDASHAQAANLAAQAAFFRRTLLKR